MKEIIYSPHYDFYIDKAHRTGGYDMKTFHMHKKYEVYYEVEGTRRYFIENSTYIVSPGNIVLIGPDSVHKTGSVENMSHTRYVLNFNPDYLADIARALPGVDLVACFEGDMNVLQASARRQKEVERLMGLLWEAQDSDAPVDVARRKLRLAELLMVLKDCVDEAKSRSAADGLIKNPIIEGVQGFIATRYTEPLTLPAIAAQFYISEQYLSRLFKRTTGLSVVEYISSIRLTAARAMLENTPMKIADVGYAAGFGTPTHFARVFKAGTGLSPQQYRKYYRAETED